MGDIPAQPDLRTSSPSTTSDRCSSPIAPQPTTEAEPVLCQHCRRTASNGISCQGFCVADSGY